jgi:YesN/AraC family two-component response regulator
MTLLGNILIADDEETFLESTADLLRLKGYECTTVSNAGKATELLMENNYDLLIADIKMPGNPELELIETVSRLTKGLPVILVTGYPTLKTAIMSIKLPVVGYLLKPIELTDLLDLIQVALEHSRLRHSTLKTQAQLKTWNDELANLVMTIDASKGQLSQITVESYLNITLHNIIDSINSLKNITEAMAGAKNVNYACDLLNCPRDKAFYGIIEEVINTIKNTKRSFKSNDLGALRIKLEELLKNEHLQKIN